MRRLLENQQVVGKRKKRPRLLFLTLGLFLASALVLFVSSPSSEYVASDSVTDPPLVSDASSKSTASDPPEIEELSLRTLGGKVKRNQSFYDLMVKYGVSPKEIGRMTASAKGTYDLRKVMPGRTMEVTLDEDSNPYRMAYSVDPENTFVIQRVEDGYDAFMENRPFEIYTNRAEGVIESTLFEAVQSLGKGPELAVQLAEIFAWDIDFHFDIRKGDRFKVFFEEKWKDGKFYGYGRILAAEFTNQGEELQAVFFETSDGKKGYYTPDGKSLQKQFLRSPLQFRRISSKFTYKRFHPVLKRYKPHLGVDYVAPVGTAVHSAGDGKVIFAGRKGGNGKFVKIRHNQVYMTGYLHLSRIAKGIRSGKKVSQGQVIGYVGQTGLATGPHLCYRFYKYGKFVNPLTVKFPSASPVPKKDRSLFAQVRENRLNQLMRRTPGYVADRNGYLIAGSLPLRGFYPA